MGFKNGKVRRLLAASALLLTQALGLGCESFCEQSCFNHRVECEESCDRHFDRVLDPDGWSYCLQDCAGNHDGCVAICDADEDT